MDYDYINEMTQIYEDHKNLTNKLNQALQEFKDHQKELEKLEKYYYSDKFSNDYDASNKGEIPSEINQGILTEDAIYDLLGDNYYMARELLDLANYIIQDKEE
ncbi:DUF4298 domain-containing protein [Anaerococcus sp. DFU013_CI05]|uniref:DUF4298 domain-containing protein n=1 Tax=unclassified Anaerococcus TaxID=2614126 RepID=UPI001932A64A|nr:DUF4298 domain-containing protein [Anaerococcus sp. mt242]MBM0045815.1 DUF4298 domain-containing protein [Anaerococcus sp. mt242]